MPRSVRLGEAPSYGEPILSYAPTSSGGVAYAQLADELLEGDRALSERLNAVVQKDSSGIANLPNVWQCRQNRLNWDRHSMSNL